MDRDRLDVAIPGTVRSRRLGVPLDDVSGTAGARGHSEAVGAQVQGSADGSTVAASGCALETLAMLLIKTDGSESLFKSPAYEFSGSRRLESRPGADPARAQVLRAKGLA